MIPANSSHRHLSATKLLVFSDKISHTTVAHLADYFSAGDLLIVNRSATLPSSFRGHLQRTGEFVEIRLAAFQGPTSHHLENWLAFSFDAGNWRTPTEKRSEPPKMCTNDKIIFGPDLFAEVVDCKQSRLLKIRFVGDHLTQALYRYGRPIQYSYLTEELQIWDQQTIFAGPPISVEPPSAAFPFTWELILKLKAKNVKVASLLHGGGISSTGSDSLDKLLPLKEWYEIPAATVKKLSAAKQNNKKIIALGTTVLRALESAWHKGEIQAGDAMTDLKITGNHKIQTVHGLITGMHEVGASHRQILNSFFPSEFIEKAYQEVEAKAYRGHEYGDISLLIR